MSSLRFAPTGSRADGSPPPLLLSFLCRPSLACDSIAAYLAGKKEALQDVLEFLQASLDHPQPTSSSVSRLIDYIW